MPKQYSGGFSRSVHHGNMMNKRGMVTQYQKSVVSRKVPMKFKRQPVTLEQKVPMIIEEEVVKGKPPKPVKSKETRYTIPDVPTNGNIATQTYVRSHTKMAVIMNELKTHIKVNSFNVDVDHEIEIL